MFKCLIRNRIIKRTPEEIVRQSLLNKMIFDLGFLRGLIAVEKQVGTRRYDLVSYTPEMRPLLLVECKAGPIEKKAASQAFGYNDEIKAPFVSLANANEVRTFWRGNDGLESVPFLPTYKELYEISKRC